MVTECSCPLISSSTVRASGPTVRSLCKAFVSRANAFADSMTVVAAATPAPFRNPRRENLVLGPSAMGTAFRMLNDKIGFVAARLQPHAISTLYIQRHASRHPDENDLQNLP